MCFEHTGYAKQKAESWWEQRSDAPVPETVEEAVELARSGWLAEPERITVRSVSGEKFDRIVDYELGEKPEYISHDEETEPEGEFAWPEGWGGDDDIPF